MSDWYNQFKLCTFDGCRELAESANAGPNSGTLNHKGIEKDISGYIQTGFCSAIQTVDCEV